MEETVDELVTKHTRRELEEMAMALGVEPLGGTKMQLSEAIIEARKAQTKKPPAPAVTAKPAPPPPLMEAPKEAPKAPPAPKEAPKEKLPSFGKRGVLAKSEAIENMAKDMQNVGKAIREDGIREMKMGLAEFELGLDSKIRDNKEAVGKMHTGVRGIQSEIGKKSRDFQKTGRSIREDGIRQLKMSLADFNRDLDSHTQETREAVSKFNSGASEIRSEMDRMSGAFQKAGKDIREEGTRNLKKGLTAFGLGLNSQIRENREAVARMTSGVRGIQDEMEKKSMAFQKAGKDIREEGTRNLKKGLTAFGLGLNSQIRANREAAAKMTSGARELQSSAMSFQNEIQRYGAEDLKGYVKDFYYG
jgi:uncharacterized phage infection (PIP) family protein YhgE